MSNTKWTDRRWKEYRITNTVCISTESVPILYIRSMRKLCATWMRHLLNIDQKQKRKQIISQKCLDCFKMNPTVFRWRIVTMDKRKKQQSKLWVDADGSTSKKASKSFQTKISSVSNFVDVLIIPSSNPSMFISPHRLWGLVYCSDGIRSLSFVKWFHFAGQEDDRGNVFF